jgi:hypothetical protein
MTKKYNQLTLEQRDKIEALVSAGNTQTVILPENPSNGLVREKGKI